MRYVLILSVLFYSLFGLGSFLMPEEAFTPSAKIEGDKLIVQVDLADSIYLYKDKLKVEVKNENLVLQDVLYPQSELHDKVEIYKNSVVLEATIAKKGDITESVDLVLNYQGCSEQGLCYEPIEKTYNLKIDISKINNFSKAQKGSVKEVSETDTITQTFQSGNIPLILLTFFGFGLLLALTPCVFPLIPILSSIIVSQGEGMNAKRGFMLSLVYVLAMSVAYTFAGVLAGLFGNNIQASMQNPFVLSAFAAIFVILAFSMFGFFEIGLPSSIQSKLSNRSHSASKKGGFAGVAVMGFLSALIVGPCVAPPLAGALVYIGQTGDAVLGGVALFVMSLGMGLPLLLIGVGAGKFMPRPGGWMSSVSKVFGVVMLMIALWMLSRVLPEAVIMFLWALLLIISSVYLGAFEPLEKGKKSFNALFKGSGIFLFMIGGALLIGVVSGSANILDPLEKFTAKQSGLRTSVDANKNSFVKIGSIDELDALLEKHKGKKIMLDFYADWCTSCKELEHKTFSDSNVQNALKDYVLIQADITENSKENKKLSGRFGLFGPPAILFFDENSHEIKHKRVVGYKSSSSFLEHLKGIE